MNISTFFRISLMFMVVISFLKDNTAKGILPIPLIMEIYSDTEINRITFQPEDIEKVGINDTLGETRVEITIVSNYHSIIEKLTKENKGKKIVLRTEGETLFSGTIFDPLSEGRLAIRCPSEKEARAIINKMGRKPDFLLKPTPEDLESSKSYTEPAKNPWSKKAIYSELHGDYMKAERFAKKAIESAPNEPSYHELLGTIYYNQGKKIFALEELLTAEKLSKKEILQRFPGTYLSIADLYSELNEFEKAIEYITKVLLVNENNLLAHLDLAKIYEKMGEYDLAIQQYILLSESGDDHFRKKGLEGIKRLKGK